MRLSNTNIGAQKFSGWPPQRPDEKTSINPSRAKRDPQLNASTVRTPIEESFTQTTLATADSARHFSFR